MSTAAVDQFDELPRIKGPKLRRFKDGHYGEIEYLKLLRSNDEEQLPNGDHGYNFSVRIDGEPYMLKIVRPRISTTYWRLIAASFHSTTRKRLSEC